MLVIYIKLHGIGLISLFQLLVQLLQALIPCFGVCLKIVSVMYLLMKLVRHYLKQVWGLFLEVSILWLLGSFSNTTSTDYG